MSGYKKCPECKEPMTWVKRGWGKRADGSPVRLGYWMCTNPKCIRFGPARGINK